MNTSTASPIDQPIEQPERIWPLDAAIGALASLVLYLIVTKLTFDDPRWLHNGWTYVVSVPLVALLLAIGSRFIVSRYVHKSLQLGLFFSVFVHLLLLTLAVNVIIFRNYFPDALTGVKQERVPIRHSVPEYLFQSPNENAPTPDWSKPVDAETASRVIPTEKRQLPPVDFTAEKLEVPRPVDPEQRPIQKSLIKRETPSESIPQPAESPGRLATPQRTETAKSVVWSPDKPVAPDVRSSGSEADAMNDRPVDATSPARLSEPQESTVTKIPEDLPEDLNEQQPPRIARTDQRMMPEINPSQSRRIRSEAIRRPIQAAGASPSTAGIVLQRSRSATERMTENVEVLPPGKSATDGASLAMQERNDSSLTRDENFAIASITPQRTSAEQSRRAPAIATGEARRRPNSPSRSGRSSQKFFPAGAPAETSGVAVASSERKQDDQQISDRLADSDPRRANQSRSNQPPTRRASQSGPALDLLLENGPLGMASRVNRSVGIIPGESIPEISALEIRPGKKRRRDLGGPVTPAGTKIAATESFSRRVKRTEGGATPTPAGAVGPATEKAIERGLAYLASIQNADGSWSLQGHGSEVVLRSDTAATGLCLLAFQGAGYTHRQHQYADTISRGLKFLLDNQQTNGNLYRKENQISNQNVSLYSHGIASLALCEAYGMTQDPELKDSAQGCVRYIVETQHRKRGGWRYAPQVSSDTSVTGWMMMALKSGELARLDVPKKSYVGIKRWLKYAQGEDREDRYRYNPFAPDTPTQRHGRVPTPTMTAVGMLMRMYMGWHRDNESMQSAADYLMQYPPQMGSRRSPQRDGYYWYYATMVMFHMGGDHWQQWNSYLKPVLLESQVDEGDAAGSWDPVEPVPDRWSPHAGRIYVTTMNLLNLEVYYRHLPIYSDSAE